MVKAIIFDWGGVLIEEPSRAMHEYCARHLGVSYEDFVSAYRNYAPDFHRNALSEEEFWEFMGKDLGTSKPHGASLWGDSFKQACREDERMFSLISLVKEKGYTIGLLSNTEMPVVNYFYTYLHGPRYKIFDALVFSCVEGIRKPEREIYELALKRLSIKPEEAVFVDDREENIKGAKEVGLWGITFTSIEALTNELRKLPLNLS